MTAAVLNRATGRKDDEFYTPIEAITKELVHYSRELEGKRVLCNCRDYYSHFDTYFRGKLGEIQELVTVGDILFKRYTYRGEYNFPSPEVLLYISGGDASYCDEFGLKLLGECDIVVTNPPFSKIRHFIQTIVEAGKDFIVVAPLHAVGNKVLGNYLVEGKLNIGYTRIKEPFRKSDGSEQKFGNCVWFTSFPVHKPSGLNLTKKVADMDYRFYDNPYQQVMYVPRTKDIPVDFDGIMAVPLSYLEHHNPDEFEFVDGRTVHKSEYAILAGSEATIDGKHKFTRLLIRRKK